MDKQSFIDAFTTTLKDTGRRSGKPMVLKAYMEAGGAVVVTKIIFNSRGKVKMSQTLRLYDHELDAVVAYVTERRLRHAST